MNPVARRSLQVGVPRSTIPAAPPRRPGLVAGVIVLAALAACARQPEPGRVVPGVEQRAVGATRPTSSRLLLFRWSLREGASRFSGAAAARVTPDYRARLDLFGPQDVSYLSAILREGRLVLPAGVPGRVVPPAPLLWSAFGVVQPPAQSTLTNAVEAGDETTLSYRGADGTWTFRLRGSVLAAAEWQSADGARHTVELSGGAAGIAPRRAVYRDWQEYRELVLDLEEQEDVEGFPPETWILEAR